MFKENYIKKLALDNIKKQRKLYKYIFIALFMSFFLSSLVFILFTSYQRIGYDERVSHYGMWSLAVENIQGLEMPEEENMKKGNIYFLNNISFLGRNLGKLGALDKDAQYLTSLTYLKGHYPQNNGEIAMEENQLTFLGLKPELNQSVEFSIDGENKTYKIVGIIKNYSQNYQISIPSFFIKGNSQNYITLYKYKDNATVLNKLLQNKQDKLIEVNNLTYNNIHYEGSQYKENLPNKYMEIMIIFIGFVGVLSTTFSSMNKRREYFILLRCLGATSLQIQKMVMYESIFLMILGSFLGIAFGIVLSVLLIYIYHMIMNGPMTIVMNWNYIPQFFYTFLIAFISMFIASLSAYSLPLTGKVIQKSHHIRKRKIRNINVFSMAFYELVDHKLVSFMLIAIVVVWAFFAHSSVSQMTSYLKSRERYQDYGFQYTLVEDGDSQSKADISNEEYLQLSQMKGVSSQMRMENLIRYHYDAMNEVSLFYEDTTIKNQVKMDYGSICTYLDMDMIDQILHENDFQGRLPLNDNEVVVLLPYYYMIDGGYGSSLFEIDDEELIQIPLKLGDNVDVYPENLPDNQQCLEKIQSLKVTGIVQLNKEYEKLYQLFNETLLIVNNKTYQKLFPENSLKSLYIDLDKNVNQLQYKESIFQLLKNHSQYEYKDNYANMLSRQSIELESFLKEITFIGILLIGITVLIYTQRKLRIMSMKNEIGLLKAIGATQSQIFISHALYALMIYILGYSGYMFYLYILFSGKGGVEEFKTFFMQPMQLVSMIMFCIIFVIVMVCSAYQEVRKNPLDLITKEE